MENLSVIATSSGQDKEYNRGKEIKGERERERDNAINIQIQLEVGAGRVIER